MKYPRIHLGACIAWPRGSAHNQIRMMESMLATRGAYRLIPRPFNQRKARKRLRARRSHNG